MKLSILALATLATLAALTGCAAPTLRTETDHDKVFVVERAARLHGYQVVWINTPTKVVKATNGT